MQFSLNDFALITIIISAISSESQQLLIFLGSELFLQSAHTSFKLGDPMNNCKETLSRIFSYIVCAGLIFPYIEEHVSHSSVHYLDFSTMVLLPIIMLAINLVCLFGITFLFWILIFLIKYKMTEADEENIIAINELLGLIFSLGFGYSIYIHFF